MFYFLVLTVDSWYCHQSLAVGMQRSGLDTLPYIVHQSAGSPDFSRDYLSHEAPQSEGKMERHSPELAGACTVEPAGAFTEILFLSSQVISGCSVSH